jgi:hypothetical protein
MNRHDEEDQAAGGTRGEATAQRKQQCDGRYRHRTQSGGGEGGTLS